MKKINLELPDDLSKDVGIISKENGMTKAEWMVSAITLVRDKYQAKKAEKKELLPMQGYDELVKHIDATTTMMHSDPVGEPGMEGTDGEVSPLDETGQQPIPAYTMDSKEKIFLFFMNDGGEQEITASSKEAAMEKLGIGDNEYLDFIES